MAIAIPISIVIGGIVLMTLLRFFQGLMIVFLLHGGSSWAATYWVSKTGSDSNPCFASNTQPNLISQSRRSIMAGAACLRSGDTLMVMPGNYNEHLLNPLPNNATLRSADPNPANWFVLRPQNNVIPHARGAIHHTLARNDITYRFLKINLSDITSGNQPQGCVVEGNVAIIRLTVEDFECIGPAVGMGNWSAAAIGLNNAGDAATIRRGVIRGWHSEKPDGTGPGNHGVYWQSGNGLIEHVWIEDMNGRCVSYRYNAHNNVFRYNVCKDTVGVLAVSGGTGSDHVIHNSIFWQTEAVSLRESGQKFFNNVIYGATARSCLQLRGSNHVVQNNIMLNCVGGTFENDSTGSTISHNVTKGNPSEIFVDHTKGNFALRAGSPAIDAGTTIQNVTRDFVGTPRPQGCCYDIGAFEYMPVGTKPPAPSNVTIVE